MGEFERELNEEVEALLHVWPDIEEALLQSGDDELADAVRRAFRVEAFPNETFTGAGYSLLYNVEEPGARQAARVADHSHDLAGPIRDGELLPTTRRSPAEFRCRDWHDGH